MTGGERHRLRQHRRCVGAARRGGAGFVSGFVPLDPLKNGKVGFKEEIDQINI